MLITQAWNLFPKVLFPTPVGPRRTIRGWGRVASVHPHVSAIDDPRQWRTRQRNDKDTNMVAPRPISPKCENWIN